MPEISGYDHPQDALYDCGCALDFVQEALSIERQPGQALQLGDAAAQGLCVILADAAARVRAAEQGLNTSATLTGCRSCAGMARAAGA